MPLSSSRAATEHRAAKVAAERKEQDRRQRLSLPMTIDSTTSVTKSKVKRRQSLRRKSITSNAGKKRPAEAECGNENVRPNVKNRLPPKSPGKHNLKKASESDDDGPRLYSPPMTRSAKKKCRPSTRPDFDGAKGGNGMVLLFSPPNQEENERVEQERIAEVERKRAERVAQARANGQLLVFSPSNREILMDLNDDEDVAARYLEGETPVKEIPCRRSSFSDTASNLTEHQTHSSHTKGSSMRSAEYLGQFEGVVRQEMQKLAQSMQKNTQSTSTESELLLHSQKLHRETLGQLDQANKCIQAAAGEKQTHLVEHARLQADLVATKREAEFRQANLQEKQLELQNQLKSMCSEKDGLSSTIVELERELTVVRQQLKECQGLVESHNTKYTQLEKDHNEKVARMEAKLESSAADLNAMKETKLASEITLQSVQDRVDELIENIVPNMERSLDEARLVIDQKNQEIIQLESLREELSGEVARGKQELAELEAARELERCNFQKRNEDSGKEFADMTQEARHKDKRIEELLSEVEAITDKHRSAEQTIADLEESQKTLYTKSNELTFALEETFQDLERAEQDNSDLKEKLADAIKGSENVLAEKNEAVVSLAFVEAQLANNQDRISELESRVEHLSAELVDKETELSDSNSKVQELIKENRNAVEDRNGKQMQLAEDRDMIRELQLQNKLLSEQLDEARGSNMTFNQREDELYRKLRESDRIRREMHSRIMQLMGNIRVFVRVRPALNGEVAIQQEKDASAKVISKTDTRKRKRDGRAHADGEETFRFPGVYDREEKKTPPANNAASDDLTKNFIEVREPPQDRGGLKDRRKKWRFGFDRVFSPEHGQEDVWEATEPLIQSAVDGFNVTIFAYGQTGSGKTHTMLGEPGNEGLIARSVRKLFETKVDIESLARGEQKVDLSVEILEIYNEKIRDLLVPNSGPDEKDVSLKITSKEVEGNTVAITNTFDEVMGVLAMAQERRCVKATDSNADSSRSHMVFTIHFDVTTKDGVQRNGKLNVCDLAGSERLSKSGAHLKGGKLFEETKNINKSLSTLSNVIERLQAGDANVPFRESKLTFLLKNSLTGNSKTLAIVCCNPLPQHVNESVCSLRFAEKVARVDLKAAANFSC